MGKIKCPGQDTRFWRPQDVFEVECGECGASVEFFKDDAYRRCPTCGTRITNPKLSLGCAQWCRYAKECLGYDPKELLAQQAEEASLADELVEALKREFAGDQPRITHALLVLERAEEIMRAEGGDPRVVVAAALLHDIGMRAAERKHGSTEAQYQELEGPPIARRIMKELGLDVTTVEHVCRIVGSRHSGGEVDTVEFRIIWDADWLVNLPASSACLDLPHCLPQPTSCPDGPTGKARVAGPPQYPDADQATLKKAIEELFRTKTGKGIAYRLFSGASAERTAVATGTETKRSEG